MDRVEQKAVSSNTGAKDLVEFYREERIAHLTRLCARGFNRALTRRLAEHGISFGQWVFLRILWKEEGLTQKQLSELANLTEPTVHTALNKLEQQGIITRRTKAGNKRKQHIYLSKPGRDLQEVLEPLAVEANDTALRGIDPDERERFRQMLIVILANLECDEVEAEARGLRIPPTRAALAL